MAKKYHREDIQSISKPSPPGSVVLVAAYNLQETSQSLKPPSATFLQHTNRTNELSPPLLAPSQFSDPPMGHSQPPEPSNLANKTTYQPSPSPNIPCQPTPPTKVPSQLFPPTKMPSQPTLLTMAPSQPALPTTVLSQSSPPILVPRRTSNPFLSHLHQVQSFW